MTFVDKRSEKSYFFKIVRFYESSLPLFLFFFEKVEQNNNNNNSGHCQLLIFFFSEEKYGKIRAMCEKYWVGVRVLTTHRYYNHTHTHIQKKWIFKKKCGNYTLIFQLFKKKSKKK